MNYLRRTVLNPAPSGGHLLERLTELARREVAQLRATRFASTARPESSQVISVMVRQHGHLFLQPMIDALWRQLAEPGATDADKPVLEVRVRGRAATERELCALARVIMGGQPGTEQVVRRRLLPVSW